MAIGYPATDPSGKREPTMENRLIMVVDDSTFHTLQLCQLFNEHGYRTVVAHSGKEALARLEEELPAIVFADIIMPEMDGYQLCRAIRASEAMRELPVVLLTCLSNPKDVLQAIESGADYFFSKPYNADYLISRTAEIIRARRSQKASFPENETTVVFDEACYTVKPDVQRVVDLLISTYEASVLLNKELLQTQRRLSEKIVEQEATLERMRQLEGIIPICMYCKKIRDDENSWHHLEKYLSEHSDATFSHGMCPDCFHKVKGDFGVANGRRPAE